MKKILLSIIFAIIITTFFSCDMHSSPSTSKTTKMKPESKKKKDPMKNHNRLIYEQSPYLIQHAENPVDWYPWGEEAFEKAAKENKPIFLSIGYSTCHWCHVMEHESFENEEVARLMNDVFVSIKVDREERPDIDNVYMRVCQIMTGRGGWPLTVFLTPDKKPFFAGTYIPRESKYGRLGMLELIPRIQEAWNLQNGEILKSADQITSRLNQTSMNVSGEEFDMTNLKVTYEQLSSNFSQEYGGFSKAPKFPSPQKLLFLLRYWQRTSDKMALKMVIKTLQSMHEGGLYDHIGYGFHRYSTDSQWLVPHFEKMLYDQAMLAMAYVEAFQATAKTEFKKIAKEIFTYVQRDMTDSEGGFYSAEDADSEGKEGKYYVWTEKEIRKILQTEEADLIIDIFNVKESGNFKDEASGENAGANILHLKGPLSSNFLNEDKSLVKLEERVEKARKKLFIARDKRIHPYKDDKILTDWNGLMIAAFSKGAQACNDPKYSEVAKRAADFILSQMRRSDGRLLHRYRNGDAGILANIDDYAFLIWGLLELYETIFDVHYLDAALRLSNEMIKYFWDNNNGGFYFTAYDAEQLIVRQKESYDGAIPSGNSVAILNLLRLARITANSEFEDKANKILQAFSKEVKNRPSSYAQMMIGVDFIAGPSYEVVIVGDMLAEDTKEMLNAIRTHFIPNKVVLLKPSDQEKPDIIRLAKFTEYQSTLNGKATAYVCLDYACKLPVTDPEEMLKLLNISF